MNWRKLSVLVCGWCLIVGGVSPENGAAAPGARGVDRSDFAIGRTIEVSGRSPIYSFELPEDVYRTVTRQDLGDIRVINGMGVAVPHELVREAPGLSENSTASTIPFFPIESGSSTAPGGDAVEITHGPSGEVVKVSFAGERKGELVNHSSYLLDLRSLKGQLRTLKVAAEDLPQNAMVQLRVEGSNDLANWRPYPSSGVLARMNYLGSEVLQDQITLSGERVNFMRVSVPRDAQVTLSGVSGTFVSSSRPVVTEQKVFVAGEPESYPLGTFRYTVGGYLPVQSVSLSFPQMNTLVSMMISSRMNENTPWTTRAGGSAYRLSIDNSELVSRPYPLSFMVSDRFWRVEFSGSDAKFSATPPTLELGWIPHQLHFVAQGEAPFELVYGSATTKPADFGGGSLVSVARGTQVGVQSALLQSPREIGGVSRLLIPPEPVKSPLSKWALWGVLVAFLLVIGWMAVQLGRDLKKQ